MTEIEEHSIELYEDDYRQDFDEANSMIEEEIVKETNIEFE